MRRSGRGFGSKPKSKRKKRLGLKFYVIIAVIIAVSIFAFRQIDNRLLPPALAAANMKVKTQMNIAINNALHRIIEEKQATAEDFFTKVQDSNGKVSSISVNTVLVNEVCNSAAVAISQELNTLGGEKVSIPIGIFMGVRAFANTGPHFNFTVLPVGDASVDYESQIDTAGINQTMFQVFITVDATVQIVNPMQNGQVNITRKIPLVNAVISNDVPGTYLTANRGE